ncbi:MAG: hypothetical protein OXU51_16575 [Candidatus Poribacteria bacterium]|nr:hypothetical protein [Candidatus Poribacteria bacterium]
MADKTSAPATRVPECRRQTVESSKGTANLRVSYLGGGYDFPEFSPPSAPQS